jgi:hypothetical protein
MNNQSDQDPILTNETNDSDVISAESLLTLKKVIMSETEYAKIATVADTSGEEVTAFLASNGIEAGDDIVIQIQETGNLVVMDTSAENFGDTDRKSTTVLNEHFAINPEAETTFHEEIVEALGQEALGDVGVEEPISAEQDDQSETDEALEQVKAIRDGLAEALRRSTLEITNTSLAIHNQLRRGESALDEASANLRRIDSGTSSSPARDLEDTRLHFDALRSMFSAIDEAYSDTKDLSNKLGDLSANGRSELGRIETQDATLAFNEERGNIAGYLAKFDGQIDELSALNVFKDNVDTARAVYLKIRSRLENVNPAQMDPQEISEITRSIRNFKDDLEFHDLLIDSAKLTTLASSVDAAAASIRA